MKPIKPDEALLGSIEGFLKGILLQFDVDPASDRGRRRILPGLALWAGMVVCVARGFSSQLELWRLLSEQGLWDFPRFGLGDEAVRKRLRDAPEDTVRKIFEQVTTMLLAQKEAIQKPLAGFAKGVFAIDEMTLDAVAKRLPSLHKIEGAVLPGKVSAIFDIRMQLWKHVAFQANPLQNSKVAARGLLDHIETGSMILADLGYFAFEWFDDLTRQGYHWVSRLRKKTSYTLIHVLHESGSTLDAIVFLGAHRADRSEHAVRLVCFTIKETTFTYITNVLQPELLSIREISALYARRWDIEMMFNMVKTHLHLHMIWSGYENVVQHQLFAVFTVAQCILGLRSDLAQRADVDVFDISLDLMIRWIPRFAKEGSDPIAILAERGRRMMIIRPSTRNKLSAPEPPLTQYSPLPADLQLTRAFRYARKN